MWYTREDEDCFEVDFSSYSAMKELEKETESKPKVTVQRRKFPHKQIVPCAKPIQQKIQSSDPPKAVQTPNEPLSSPATQQDKPIIPPATNVKLQLIGALLYIIIQ